MVSFFKRNEYLHVIDTDSNQILNMFPGPSSTALGQTLSCNLLNQTSHSCLGNK